MPVSVDLLFFCDTWKGSQKGYIWVKQSCEKKIHAICFVTFGRMR